MVANLRLFFARATVIELVIAFAVASALVSFVASFTTDFIISPIQTPARGSEYFPNGGAEVFAFVIAGRVFYVAATVATGIALLLVVLLAALYMRFHESVLWQDESDLRECPHCLSEINSAAAVCSFCTRDLPRAVPSP